MEKHGFRWRSELDRGVRIASRIRPCCLTVTALTMMCVWPLAHAPVAAFESEGPYDVVVVGGGIAGLTAGFWLGKRKRARILVLEKNDRPGGRTAAGIHRGFTYAKGTEYLGAPEDDYKKTLRLLVRALRKVAPGVDLESVPIPSPTDAGYADGKFYYGDGGTARLLVERSSLDAYNQFASDILEATDLYQDAPDFDPGTEGAEMDDMTVREWFNHIGAPAIFQERYNVASRGLFGANIDEISALSYIPEISFDFEGMEEPATEFDLVDETEVTTEGSESFSYVTGVAEFTDALSTVLGERLRLNATVTLVDHSSDNLYHITYQDKLGASRKVTSFGVILAVPAPVVLKIAEGVLSEEQRNLLGQIPYSTVGSLNLFSDTPIFDKAFDLALPDGWFITDVYDSTWVERYHRTGGQNNGVYIAGVGIAPQSYTDRSLVTMPETEILERALTDLEKVFPKVREKVTGHDLERHVYAYPVMTPGAYKRLARLNDINEGTLLLAGAYMAYPTWDAALSTGFHAAKKIRRPVRRAKRGR